MKPKLPTDEDTNNYFCTVMSWLKSYFNYSESRACTLIHKYYHSFRDEKYCEKIGIPVQDDDFFWHEGAGGMALRIHYYLGLKGDPEPIKFIDWRADFNKRLNSQSVGNE